jgi:hypothetical protein
MTSIEVSTDQSRLDLAMIHACKLLVSTMLAHPDLSTVIRFTLGTSDAQGLYAQFGFSAPANPERQMELIRPNGAAACGTAADREYGKITRRK